MRDPKRIKEILSAFEEVWEQHPDMRFYQLVVNIVGIDNAYYLEDDTFLERTKDLKVYLEKQKLYGFLT